MKKLLFIFLLAPLLSFGQMFGSLAADDYDAAQFISVAGLTVPANKDAINILVKDFKADNIWVNKKAIYPIIGGTSTTHKYNLKDPRDLDAAYRLTFSGTITHNSQGMKGDGSTGFADTHIIPTVDLTFNSIHVSFYGFSNSTKSNSIEVGAYKGGGVQELSMVTRRTTGQSYTSQYDENTCFINTTTASGIGYFLSNRSSATNLRLLKDGSLLGSTTANTGISGPPDVSLYLMAMHYPGGGGTVGYSDSGCEFVTIGAGLTTSQEAAQFAAVTRFHNKAR